MAMTIHVDIVSAEQEIFSGLAEMVFAPAEMGDVGIAPRHAPLITKLKPGEVRVKLSDKDYQAFYVSGGFLEVQPHLVTVWRIPRSEQKTSTKRRRYKPKPERKKCSAINRVNTITRLRKPNWRKL